MSLQTVQGVSVKIEWDDGAVIVFSFQGPSGKLYCGFPHLVPAWQSQTGTQTQVSATVQTIQASNIQISADPATWVETVKYGARGTNNTIDIAYDDSSSFKYTTQTGTGYDLQLLFSLAG